MENNGFSRAKDISPDLQCNDSPRTGDNLVVAKNLVQLELVEIVDIDVGISRFDSPIGREDGSRLELSQRFLP